MSQKLRELLKIKFLVSFKTKTFKQPINIDILGVNLES
jgi:uncharacterized membrane protein